MQTGRLVPGLRLLEEMKTKILGLMLSLAGLILGYSQGFINLDFESARIIPDVASGYYPYAIAVSNAVPGWSVFGSTQGDITYNDPAVGSSWVFLLASNGWAISGNYSIALQGGFSPYPATISQTGLVPLGTESLFFEAQSSAHATSLIVSLGGQQLNISTVATGPNYTLYGADITAFAGQNDELMFSAPSTGVNNWNIDNIQFSSSAVPEPGEFSLAALGILLLGFRCRQKGSLLPV